MTLPHPETVQKPPDTSERARSLARMIDRLAPGVYTLEIHKPSGSGGWVYELIQPVTIRSGTLPKEDTTPK